MVKLSRLAALLVVAGFSAQAQETYSQWAKYRTLTVNTTAAGGGAGVSANVTGFPLLVRLTSAEADVFAQALAGGADLRFTKADGATRLAHQIESWDAAGQSAVIWVRLDTVYGGNPSQPVRMYWSKAGAADSSSSASVFRTAENYQGVWHLGASLNDATANANNGTNTGSLDTAGAMGRGRYFNGTSNYISIPNTATMNAANPLSVEAWVRWQTIGTGSTDRYRPIINHGSANAGDQFFLYARNPSAGGDAPYYSFGYYTGTATNDAQYATNVQADALNWVHLTGTYNGTTWALYRNGVLVSSAARTGTPANATTPWYLGAFGGATTSRYFHGSLDEVRFSSVTRDSNWIRLNYETQKAAATALTVGTTQSTAAPSLITSLAYGDSAKAADTLTAFQTGIAVNVIPTYFGGPVDSFKVVTGTLPAGITVVKATGAITGSATAATAASNVTIRAWGHVTAGDSVSRTIRVSAVVGALANLHYSPDTSTLTVGVPVSRTPTYSGRAPTKYKASGLPAGLTLDSVSGLLSGTPTTVAAAANYTVTATNTAGPDTTARVLRLTVAAEDYTTWTQRDTLWLNTQTNGAGTTALVRNIPVLVRLDSTAFASVYTQSIGRGADLRFLKGTTNVRLPHQVESWDSTARRAAVWVLVDSVQPNNRTQTIRMLWGKAGAPDLSSGPSVFDTANGFQGVWHLSGTGNALDATANGLTATSTGNPPSVTGLLGPGRSFDGTSQYFIVANNARLNILQNLTISAWVNAVDWEGSRYIVVKATGMNANSQYGLRDNSTGGLILETGRTSAGIRMDNPTAPGWHLITGTYGGGFGRIYLDGTVVTSVASATDLSTSTETVGIGRRNTGAGAEHWFSGTMDEVRIQNFLRDSNWIRLEYHNQKAAQSVVWLSQPPVVVGVGGQGVARLETPGFTAKSVGGVVLFQRLGSLEGRAALEVLDMQGRVLWNGAFASGVGSLSWSGVSDAGSATSAGVYVARLTVLDKQGKAVKVMDKKVPYTR